MGMEIGTNPAAATDPYKQRTAQDIKNECAGTAAKALAKSIRIQKAKSTKKKKLNYNYKKISKQITMNNTSAGARRVITKAREEVVSLLRKQMSGKYDETDLRHAIIHARKMERIARRKKKHLEEEEKAAATGKGLVEEGAGSGEDEELKKLEESMENLSDEQKEQLEKLLEEYEELMQEMEAAGGVNDLMKEYMGASVEEMSPEEVDQLRKKHRADEMKDIVEADMKYLKSLFNKLEREKQAGVQQALEAFEQDTNPAVSLELNGVDIPVPAEVGQSAADLVAGGSVDALA
ncbi:MAG: hypothetical protein NC302_09110 [Bacteroidales bacterium]|nr:hypothetical protein [Bacteroidales bacterium]MCM1416284.1 hypothetical protein [bacterium]MCM1423481.1 hypothetical protein [bacterium]